MSSACPVCSIGTGPSQMARLNFSSETFHNMSADQTGQGLSLATSDAVNSPWYCDVSAKMRVIQSWKASGGGVILNDYTEDEQRLLRNYQQCSDILDPLFSWILASDSLLSQQM